MDIVQFQSCVCAFFNSADKLGLKLQRAEYIQRETDGRTGGLSERSCGRMGWWVYWACDCACLLGKRVEGFIRRVSGKGGRTDDVLDIITWSCIYLSYAWLPYKLVQKSLAALRCVLINKEQACN